MVSKNLLTPHHCHYSKLRYPRAFGLNQWVPYFFHRHKKPYRNTNNIYICITKIYKLIYNILFNASYNGCAALGNGLIYVPSFNIPDNNSLGVNFLP